MTYVGPRRGQRGRSAREMQADFAAIAQMSGPIEYAEVWCQSCDQPATGHDAYCDRHRPRCAYCFGERGPVVEGRDYTDWCCAACREDGGPNAGRDWAGRDDLGPEGFME